MITRPPAEQQLALTVFFPRSCRYCFAVQRSHVHSIPRFYDVALMVGFAKSSRRVPLPPIADGNPVQLLDLSGFCLRSNLSSLLDETALIRESTDK